MNCLDKFVVEPINDILIFSMLDKIHIEQLALMLEIFEIHLRVISKYVFWMLEVTFSDSRANGERCRRGFKKSYLPFLKYTCVFDCQYLMCVQLSLDKL